MSELSFLLELLLNHKLTAATKKEITERIKSVEANLGQRQAPGPSHQSRAVINKEPEILTLHNPDGTKSQIDLNAQSPSMRKKLLGEANQQEPLEVSETPTAPVAVIAQTPAAVAALQARQESIRIAASGMPEKGRTGPRKF